MNYVFLDLEWNNAFSKKYGRNINEIIEIGAVKLNEALCETDRFDVFVRSQITSRLGSRFKNLTHISNSEMKEGLPFDDAFNSFFEWCGNDFLTVTWSNSDLYAIADNFKTFQNGFPTEHFGCYLNLQKFYQSVVTPNEKNQVALSTAAGSLQIPIDDVAFHRASDDSAVTAEIFRRINKSGNWENLVIDTRKPGFYERLTFKPYYITDVNSKYFKKSDFTFRCKRCRIKAKPTGEWTAKNNQLWNGFCCPRCGRCFVGRIRAKRGYDKTSIKKTAVYKQKNAEENGGQSAVGNAENTATAES